MRSQVLKIFFYFLLFLAPTIFLWIQIKSFYNYFVTNTMFSLTAGYYDMMVKESTIKKKEIFFTIKNEIPLKDIRGKSRDFEMDVALDMEAVTFNVPMTLSILLAILTAAKLPWKRRADILFTGFLLLFLLHMVSMLLYSFCTFKAIAQGGNPYIAYYLRQHILVPDVVCVIKDFLINYAARFEPFLIAFFAWVEVKRKRI